MSGRAGSRRKVPGWCARTWRARIGGFAGRLVGGGRREGEQLAGALEVGLAGAAGEQAIVADAVEPAWQAVQQEAADELVGAEGHDLLPVWRGATIVLAAAPKRKWATAV